MIRAALYVVAAVDLMVIGYVIGHWVGRQITVDKLKQEIQEGLKSSRLFSQNGEKGVEHIE